MKFFIIIFIIISKICFAELTGYIETGKDINYNIAYTEIQFGYNIRFFDFIIMPYGNQQTWFEYRGSYGYPFNDIYTVGSELRYDNLTFDVSHFCSHKVISENSEFVNSYKPPRDGSLTKISFRYTF